MRACLSPLGKKIIPTLGWLRGLRTRRAHVLASTRFAVVGLHRSISGLGEGARLFAGALADCNAQVSSVDVTELAGHPSQIGMVQKPLPEAATTIVHLNPPELLSILGIHGRGAFPKGPLVGFWTWETERIPDSWVPAVDVVDEIWVPSAFTARAIAPYASRKKKRVQVLPYPIHKSPVGNRRRRRFGLPEDKVVVLTAADARSSFARKNPLGAIETFARADCDALLVCKLTGTNNSKAHADAVRRAAARVRNVILIEEDLSRDEMADLIMTSDVLMSLHRAEGFGLVIAEAMQRGKAVIATNYSGNMDFINRENARPIGFSFVPISDAQSVYGKGTWAEPNVEEAAAALRELVCDAGLRTKLGGAAARHMELWYGAEAWTKRLWRLLE